MCRSAVIAKMVNLAQEKSPANKVCRDLRDGGGKLGSVKSFEGGSEGTFRHCAAICPQLVAMFSRNSFIYPVLLRIAALAVQKLFVVVVVVVVIKLENCYLTAT